MYCSRASGAGTPWVTLSKGEPAGRSGLRQGVPRLVAASVPVVRGPQSALPIAALRYRISIARMDAKQVWRAALGELQVSLSPANFETWLRDTYLVDVDDQRFRIAVPNGFAKDWLETRYRSLISQTLARVVGYSVQVEFVVTRGPRRRRRRSPTIADAARPRGADPGRCARRARPPARPTSTRATPSRTSSSARPTGSPTRRRCRWPSGPGHAYNPLFLYGGVGLGKTHLMHAIGNAVAAQVPAQARRLRDVREVHQRVHHLDPAGQDRRVPCPLPPDRPAPDRRHPVHRGQGADAGRVLPHVQRDPRGRQADRPVARTGRRRRS